MKTILQILPCAPGPFNGVADYALNLARVLRNQHQADTIFMTAEPRTPIIESFPVVTMEKPQRFRAMTNARCDGVILHYVNYGFQKRGVPFSLVCFLKTLRRECGVALLVIFHELFATGRPWKSEFWLRPFQKKIARNIAQLADARLVSSESMRQSLEQLAPGHPIVVQPVPSSFGESMIDRAQLSGRDNHRWLVCGGTKLIERSLRSFLQIAAAIPANVAPKNLVVLGGTENSRVRQMLGASADIRSEYHPAIAPAEASKILSTCAFAWLDYFNTETVNADLLLKSSSFASLCAHGIVCVTPNPVATISLNGDSLPELFTITRDKVKLPSPGERSGTAQAIYNWYHRHASTAALGRAVVKQLQLA